MKLLPNKMEPMRTTATLLIATSLMTGAMAQTTGLDFTANDCAGVSHQLFADLDAGNAVIIDLVMMNCQPCVTASHAITDNVIPNVSDPLRVKFYSIGYTNSITCTQMNNWRNTNAFTHEVFAGMSAQTTYYGGMGMPTIIVLGGGSGHTVYYNELGYATADDQDLIDAINDALAGATSVSEAPLGEVSIHPNPATDVLTISGSWSTVRVMDLSGRVVLTSQLLNGKLDVETLLPGQYVLVLSDREGLSRAGRFEKR
jgi:hypothetical protein